MRLKTLFAAVGVAVLWASLSRPPPKPGAGAGALPAGWCGPQPVSHFIYYPRYSNVYHWATLVPYPGAYRYMPDGYDRRYNRPYGQYARRFWAPRRAYGAGCRRLSGGGSRSRLLRRRLSEVRRSRASARTGIGQGRWGEAVAFMRLG